MVSLLTGYLIGSKRRCSQVRRREGDQIPGPPLRDYRDSGRQPKLDVRSQILEHCHRPAAPCITRGEKDTIDGDDRELRKALFQLIFSTASGNAMGTYVQEVGDDGRYWRSQKAYSHGLTAGKMLRDR